MLQALNSLQSFTADHKPAMALNLDSSADAQSTPVHTQLAELVGWACDTLDNSGRYGVSFRCDRAGRLFVTPSLDAETFFTDATGTCRVDDPDSAAFLEAHADANLGYGFPVRVDHRGFITPLLYCDVAASRTSEGWQVTKQPARRPRLHRRVLIEAGYDTASADRITEFVERTTFRSLRDCLEQTARVIGVDPDALIDGPLRVLNGQALPRPGWHRTPVLFPLDPPDFHRGLRTELQRLPDVYAASQARNALTAVIDQRPRRGRPANIPVQEVLPLSEDLLPVTDSVIGAPFAVAEAPPGTNRMALIADAIATLAADGNTVLFVTPNATFLQHLCGRLQAFLARQERWIITLGKTDLRDRLLATIRTQRRRRTQVSAESAATADLRIDGFRRGFTQLRSTLEPLRRGQDLWSRRQKARLALAAQVPRPWVGLLELDFPIPQSREQLNQLRTRALALAEPLGGRAVSRLLRRGGGGADEERDELLAALQSALARVPPDKRRLIPSAVVTVAESPEAPRVLAQAFDALAQILDHRRAVIAERQAAEAVLQASTSHDLDEQIVDAHERVVVACRDQFRRRMRDTLSVVLTGGEARINAALDCLEEHAAKVANGEESETDASAAARQIAALAKGFPIWTALAKDVPAMLPLVGGLFDMVVIDDADRLPAPAMLPLLFRGKRALVVGVSQGLKREDSRSDGLVLAASVGHAPKHTLTVNNRSHPLIVEYLSETFHEGKLHARVPFAAMRQQFPTLVMGMHWHDVGPHAELGYETELSGAVSLLYAWDEAGLFSDPRPRTIGIVTPQRDRVEMLARNLEGMMPVNLPMERVALGTPERFHGVAVDLMLILPGIDRETPPAQAERLANDRALYQGAVAAARVGVHVVASAAACRAAGGMIADLYRHACYPDANPDLTEGSALPGNPRLRLAALLDHLNLCFRPEGTGFKVYSRFGGTYLIGIAAAGEFDEPDAAPDGDPTVVIMIEAQEILRTPQRVLRRLERLV